MWAICKKELRQFFSSLTGYIAIIVFLLVNGLMLFVFENNILDFGYATLDRFFGLAPWVLLLLIPAITMRSFSDEFRTGTFEILQTRPLSPWQITIGKYLGCLLVAVIALVPTIVYYFSIQALSTSEGIDTGAAIGAYTGLFFLAAVFTAIGACTSSFTSNAIVSFITSLILCALLYYGFAAISKLPGLRGGADYYSAMAGIDFHYSSISRGVIDTRDIIYFGSMIFLFLAIANRNLSKDRGRTLQTTVSRYWWLTLPALLLAVNFLASGFHFRFDLTKEKRYTLSKATKELLAGLEDDMQVDVFLKGDFPAGFRKLANSTGEFLQLLKDRNGARVHYRFISPQDEIPGTGAMYADSLTGMGAVPINLTVQKKAGESVNIIFPVAVMHYKGKRSLVSLYPGASSRISQEEINGAEALMEYQFIKTLDKLVRDKRPGIAYATGNGEPVDARAYDLVQTLEQDYAFGIVNLPAQPVIPDVDVLLIVKPTEQFTEAEKLKIDQYVMRGGKLLCFIDNLIAEQDSLAFKPETIGYDRNLNLTDLLFRYGARINTDLVMDLQCDMIPLVVGGTAENPQLEFLRWNYFPLFEPVKNQLLNKNLGYIAGRFVNSVDTIQVPGIRKSLVLASSPNARIIKTPALISLNENKDVPEDEKFRQAGIPVAVLLEGKFTSLYKNRASQAQRDSLAGYGTGFRDESADNKIIVVADGDMVLNDMLPVPNAAPVPLPMGWNKYTYREYQRQSESGRLFIPVANREFLLSCIEYLVNNPAIMETRNKDIVLRLLDSKKINEQKLGWQLINIALPVLLVILAGLAYQQVRRRKYARLG